MLNPGQKIFGGIFPIALILLVALAAPVPGSTAKAAGSDSSQLERAADTTSVASESGDSPVLLDVTKLIGVDEKLGQMADLDLTFLDSRGREVLLSDHVDRPTILLPVYYHCPTACQVMIGGLSQLVNDIPLALGDEYRIVAVSFDYEDTPEIANRSRANYIPLIDKEPGPDDFLYLTGTRENIQRLLDSVGYQCHRREARSYLHPNAIIVLAADGKIIRYLYGPEFLAFDIGMALTEAEKGTPSLSIRKLMTYCFSYNPEKRTYTFTAVRYIMIAVLLILALVMMFLLRRKRREA